MRIITQKNNYGFYIIVRFNTALYYTDEEIAKLLSIPLKEYRDILARNNAAQESDSEHFFTNIEDVDAAIEDLQPYIIMLELIGE